MNKIPKVIFGCILAAMVLTIGALFILHKNKELSVSNGLQSAMIQSADSRNDSSDQSMPAKNLGRARAVAKMGDSVVTDGFTYRVDKVTKSKKRGVLPVPVDFSSTTFDKNGTITGSCSYLTVTLDIKNNTDQESEIYFNSTHIIYMDDKGTVLSSESGGEDPWVMDINQKKQGKRDYFAYTFKPREDLKFHLGFIVSDNVLPYNNMEFLINNSGVLFPGFKDDHHTQYDENARFIKINWEESDSSEKTSAN